MDEPGTMLDVVECFDPVLAAVRRLREAREARHAELGIPPPGTDPSDPTGLRARLRAAQAGRPPRDTSHRDDPDALMARLNARCDEENREFLRKYHEEYADDDEAEAEAEPPARRTRQRKPSNSTLIRQVRAADERGPITITMPDGRTITSEREGSDVAAAINPWDKVLTKNATH
jgi:hypothetical protein